LGGLQNLRPSAKVVGGVGVAAAGEKGSAAAEAHRVERPFSGDLP